MDFEEQPWPGCNSDGFSTGLEGLFAVRLR